jgi:hypothetical protein
MTTYKDTTYKDNEVPRWLPLADWPVETICENQVLVEKAEGGYLQLWKNDKGKFGVVTVRNNVFVGIMRVEKEEAFAREFFSEMAYSAMAHKVVQWLIKERK